MENKNLMIRKKALEMRKDCIEMGHAAGKKAAHFGPALGCVDIVATLYFDIMKHDPAHPLMPERDRFVLSKGHACLAYYAALIEAGYLPKSVIPTFKANETILGGHPSMNPEHGIEISSGSLGNGFAVACGMAQAAKLKKEAHHVFVLVGDGECNEGVVCEAAMNAVKCRLDNLIAIVDRNGFQLSGTTEEVMNIDIPAIWSAFGWDVQVLGDGNDPVKIAEYIRTAMNRKNGKPQLIVAETVKGKGISFMERKLSWHAAPISDEQYVQAVEELRDAEKEIG